MRGSGFLWWTSAFVLAGLAGLLSYGLLKRVAPVTTVLALDTRTVVVAVTNIPLRRSISEAEVTMLDLPAETVPAGAAVSLEQVVGKMATVDLFANQPILAQQLVSPDVVTQQVALSVPRGKVVMVVPTASKLISSQLLRAGDHIDLLATFDVEVVRQQGSGPIPESIALLQNLEVHAIILPVIAPEGEPGVMQEEQGGVFRTLDESGQSVLLAVDPQDALTIRHVLNIGGIIDLTLRAPGEENVTPPLVVDQFYLADRYKIDLVR